MPGPLYTSSFNSKGPNSQGPFAKKCIYEPTVKDHVRWVILAKGQGPDQCYQKVPGLNPGWVITFPWFCHPCQIPGITPCNVQNLQEMTAPSEICWANEELESLVGKKQSAAVCG